MNVLVLLLNLAIFLVPAFFAVLYARWLAQNSRDELKLLAFVPALPLAIWGVWIAWGVTRDNTSHNLWPFELVVVGSITLTLFGGFLIVRKLAGKEERRPWQH